MTILCTALREGFVIMAADTLQVAITHATGERAYSQTHKIYVHPRLPLAIGFTGLASLQGSMATEHAAALCSGWGVKTLQTDAIDRVREHFGQLFATDPSLVSAQEAGFGTTSVVLAMAPKGVARCMFFQMKDSSDDAGTVVAEAYVAQMGRSAVFRMPALDAVYTTGPFADDGDLRGNGIGDPAQLADITRRTVEAGIDADAAAGLRRSADRPVDVVLIDRRGARIVDGG